MGKTKVSTSYPRCNCRVPLFTPSYTMKSNVGNDLTKIASIWGNRIPSLTRHKEDTLREFDHEADQSAF